jgi:hypothetical protein
VVAKIILFGKGSSHVFKKALIAEIDILSMFSISNIFALFAGDCKSREFISLVHKS